MSIADEAITCRQVVEMATDMLEGVVSESRAAEMTQHLAACPNCAEVIQQFEISIRLVGSTRAESPSTAHKQNLLRLLETVPSTATVDKKAEAEHAMLASPSSATASLPSPESSCLITDSETAQAYLDDRLPDEKQIAVLNHLIEGCDDCTECIRRTLGWRHPCVVPGEQTPDPEIVEPPIKLFEAALQLLAVGVEWSQVRARLGDSEVSFFGWLCRKVRDLASEDPSQIVVLCELISMVGEMLGDEQRAQASMVRGHILRKVRADYVEAEKWFDHAQLVLDRCQESVAIDLLRARLLRMRAMSLFDQSRSQESIEAFKLAEDLYLSLGDVARFGISLLERAGPESEIGGAASAIKITLRGVPFVEWHHSSRYGMALGQNLCLYYAEEGKWNRALLALSMARRRLKMMNSSPVDSLHMDWAAGRILQSVGRNEEAVRAFEQARVGFLSHGLASQMAWVSLDLAGCLVELGRLGEFQERGEMMLAYFVSRRLSKEALRSLAFFRDALVARSVTSAQVWSLQRSLGHRWLANERALLPRLPGEYSQL